MPQTKEITIPMMLQKLDDLYVKENELKTDIVHNIKELQQVQEDIQLMELAIMHKSNKMSREMDQ